MSDIIRHNPTALWSDAVSFNRIACFVEVPERGSDIETQTRGLLQQAERTLAAIGSDKSRLMMVTIYLTNLPIASALTTCGRHGCPRLRPGARCVRADLPRPNCWSKLRLPRQPANA